MSGRWMRSDEGSQPGAIAFLAIIGLVLSAAIGALVGPEHTSPPCELRQVGQCPRAGEIVLSNWIESHARVCWVEDERPWLEEHRIPHAIFVNKIDQARGNIQELLEALEPMSGAVPCNRAAER